MLREYVRSEIEVAVNGYEWANYTTSRELRPIGRMQFPSKPFEFNRIDFFASEPSLFLKFAQLDFDEQNAVVFANRYGINLDDGWSTSLEHMRMHVRRMRLAIKFWQAIEKRDEDYLRNFIVWKGNHSKPDLSAIKEDLNTKCHEFLLDDEDMDSYKRGDVLQPAMDLFDHWISGGRKTFALSVVRDALRRLTFRLQLDYLMDVMWVQLAFHAAEANPSRACQECGQLFSLLDNRDDRTFCSDACRVKAYRVRRKRAESMRSSGKRLHEIARELDSDIETVKKWLQPKGEPDAKKTKGTRRR